MKLLLGLLVALGIAMLAVGCGSDCSPGPVRRPIPLPPHRPPRPPRPIDLPPVHAGGPSVRPVTADPGPFRFPDGPGGVPGKGGEPTPGGNGNDQTQRPPAGL